tara:strand:+ start:5639 stop:6256 length:618 start_codon:yes stop_codon:yes gene_type:complete
MYKNQKYYSQLGQDEWVLETLNYKRNGFFIEIGAYDGIHLSNTYALEKDFGWNGICVECNPEVIPQLRKNRRCDIEEKPVIHLNDIDFPFYSHSEDKTLSSLALNGCVIDNTTGEPLEAQHTLRTIDIDTLLKNHNAPVDIDYISVDTEGAELSIVSTFDFKRYNVACWTIEHNNDHDVGTFLINLFSFNGYNALQKEWDLFFWK